jgi:tetratricopeptide (TPR) repeat protein
MKLLALAALSAALGFGQGTDCDTLEKCKEAAKANPISSLIHYRIGEFYFLQRNFQSAANSFAAVLDGDLNPEWTEVWAYLNLGKIFDATDQRRRALNNYRRALRTLDNTRGALDEARQYIEAPYKPETLK